MPVAPSARNQLVRRRRDARALVADAERLPRRSRYSARSAMIGTPLVERITTDTSVAASAASAGSTAASLLTQMLKRDCGFTV